MRFYISTSPLAFSKSALGNFIDWTYSKAMDQKVIELLSDTECSKSKLKRLSKSAVNKTALKFAKIRSDNFFNSYIDIAKSVYRKDIVKGIKETMGDTRIDNELVCLLVELVNKKLTEKCLSGIKKSPAGKKFLRRLRMKFIPWIKARQK